jgi:hypothetical protein
MKLSYSTTGTSCIEGSEEGAINLTVASGLAPRTFNWSNGALLAFQLLDQLLNENTIYYMMLKQMAVLYLMRESLYGLIVIIQEQHLIMI